MKERTEKRIKQLYEMFKKENPKNGEVPYIIFKLHFLQDDVMKLFLEIANDDIWERYIASKDEFETEFEFDWSCLPSWSNKYIAMDRCGDWFCYESEPEKSESAWIGLHFKIPKEFEPKRLPYSKGIDWTKSLTKNPNI